MSFVVDVILSMIFVSGILSAVDHYHLPARPRRWIKLVVVALDAVVGGTASGVVTNMHGATVGLFASTAVDVAAVLLAVAAARSAVPPSVPAPPGGSEIH